MILKGLVVHQWLPTFTPGDAMGTAAVQFRRALRLLGASGEIYAGETALPTVVKPMSTFDRRGEALVLYHHGIASQLAGELMHLSGPTGVVFHNITPARLYAGTRLEEPLRAGRAQLAALAQSVAVSIGVSAFNVRELVAAGHRQVHEVPLCVEPERFAGVTRRRGESLVVLSVSRVVAHKRAEDLVSLHEALKRIVPNAVLRVVGGVARGNANVAALLRRARAVGGVEFVGRLTHEQLVAEYRGADVYVSMSEHEGFGVPLIEAMASDVPVLAFGAAAVPETMAGHGVVFDTKNFAALAEVVLELSRNEALRTRVVEGQRMRVAQLSLQNTANALGVAFNSIQFKTNPVHPEPSRGATPNSTSPAGRASASRTGPSAHGQQRVAIVVQRYGADIVGGAEAHARQLAAQLSKHLQVDVLTTRAADHLTWADALPEGVERDAEVTVHRFSVERTRDMRRFNRFSKRLFGHAQDLVTEEQWVAEQGPSSPGLINAIQRFGQTHDAVIFFTSLYAPTALGLPLVADKALLVPTAHDEPPMAFHLYADAYERAQVLLCNTPEERDFIRARFPRAARARVVGVGIEPLPALQLDIEGFRAKFSIADGPYLFYVGRLEAGKGVPALINVHQAMVREFHDAPTLVLAGAGDLKPRGDRVRVLGRIDEADKWSGLSGALAAVVPSRYESLSLLALEAMAVGTPVLGNEGSPVVKGQLERSRAGLTYREHDAASFIEAVKSVGLQRTRLAANARRFAATYKWSKVVDAYLEEIERQHTNG